MYALKEKVFNNKKLLITIMFIVILLLFPVIGVIIEILFSYGNLLGTYARYIYEGKICLGFA